jgi:hypothetical protein
VIEAESQAVLVTVTEYNFQDAFKNWRKLRELCMHVEGTISRVAEAQGIVHACGRDYFKSDGSQ